MKMTMRTIALVLPLALGATTGFAAQEGLVNVNVSNVANDLAKNLKVDVSQIPVSVQVPVGVAANICNVDANVLAQQKQGEQAAQCDATSTSQALNQVVQRQIKSQ
jgi:hypothetical protein